jgi:hypothetical protein
VSRTTAQDWLRKIKKGARNETRNHMPDVRQKKPVDV